MLSLEELSFLCLRLNGVSLPEVKQKRFSDQVYSDKLSAKAASALGKIVHLCGKSDAGQRAKLFISSNLHKNIAFETRLWDSMQG